VSRGGGRGCLTGRVRPFGTTKRPGRRAGKGQRVRRRGHCSWSRSKQVGTCGAAHAACTTRADLRGVSACVRRASFRRRAAGGRRLVRATRIRCLAPLRPGECAGAPRRRTAERRGRSCHARAAQVLLPAPEFQPPARARGAGASSTTDPAAA
jgi:hypothetical protein